MYCYYDHELNNLKLLFSICLTNFDEHLGNMLVYTVTSHVATNYIYINVCILLEHSFIYTKLF